MLLLLIRSTSNRCLDCLLLEEVVRAVSTLFAIFFRLIIWHLHLTTLWADSADDKLMIIFLFFLENRIWHFMQIVSLGDNLHEVSDPIF